MRSFKRLLCGGLLFLLFVVVFSVALIEPFTQSEYDFFNDAKLRARLAGQVDTLFLCASHGVRGFRTAIIDDELDCFSYVIGGNQMTWHGREAMLREEIDRNPLKTVYVEISFNSLQRSNYGVSAIEGNRDVIVRLNGLPRRLAYFFRETPFADYDDFYAQLLWRGAGYIRNCVLKPAEPILRDEWKGYYPHLVRNDLTLREGEIAAVYNRSRLDDQFDGENIEALRRIVQRCRERNIEVVIVVTPISGERVWRYANWEVFEDEIARLGGELGCRCLDFNLLRSRYDLFSDAYSFFDGSHLWDGGAGVFTREFCRVIRTLREGGDIAPFFYDSYAEMREDSPYHAAMAGKG